MGARLGRGGLVLIRVVVVGSGPNLDPVPFVSSLDPWMLLIRDD